jgi:hypothetical protein
VKSKGVSKEDFHPFSDQPLSDPIPNMNKLPMFEYVVQTSSRPSRRNHPHTRLSKPIRTALRIQLPSSSTPQSKETLQKRGRGRQRKSSLIVPISRLKIIYQKDNNTQTPTTRGIKVGKQKGHMTTRGLRRCEKQKRIVQMRQRQRRKSGPF